MIDNILGARRPQAQSQSQRRNLLAAFAAVDAFSNIPPVSPAPFYQPMRQRSPCSSVPSTSYQNQQCTTNVRYINASIPNQVTTTNCHLQKKGKIQLNCYVMMMKPASIMGGNKGKASISNNKK